MTSLRSSPPLSRTFAWILAGSGSLAAGGCIFSSSSCPDEPAEVYPVELEQIIYADELRKALEDGRIDADECDYLCASSYEVASECELGFDADELNGTDSGVGGAAGAGGANSGEGGAGGAASPAEWISVSCSFNGYALCEGRRHASWGRRDAVSGNDVQGRWFARAAANEAGSVHSFRALARELRVTPWGRRLAPRLRQAAREEIRHARSMRSEAHARGVAVPRQTFSRPSPARSLFDIALENAREGCAFETYSALSAAHQARHAADPELRARFARIAEDETNHAELAWDLHRRFLRELPRQQASALDATLRRALRELAGDDVMSPSSAPVAPELLDIGLPDARVERHLRSELARALEARADELDARV